MLNKQHETSTGCGVGRVRFSITSVGCSVRKREIIDAQLEKSEPYTNYVAIAATRSPGKMFWNLEYSRTRHNTSPHYLSSRNYFQLYN